MQKPSQGRIVKYRGKQGLQTERAAIVTCDVRTLHPQGVADGMVPALSSDMHVHLWVYTPSTTGGFAEFDVPFAGELADGEQPAPGTWWWPPRV